MSDPVHPTSRAPLHLRPLDRRQPRPRPVRPRGPPAARPGRVGAPPRRARRLRRQLPRRRPGAVRRRRRPSARRSSSGSAQALDDTGMKVPMATTNLFSPPGVQGGRVHRQRPRRSAASRCARRSTRSTSAPSSGADGVRDVGRPRGRRGRRRQGRPRSRSTATRRRSTCAASTSASGATTCGSRSSRSRTSRAATSSCRPSATRSRSSASSSGPTWSASTPSSPTRRCRALTFTHAVAQTLWHGKLFHIDLNAQRIGKYDQDFRFGSEGIRDAFYLVRLLEDSGWDGMRHFDAHPYRTEDADGVWDFARGCMRTYLILAEKAAPLPRRRRDPGGARAPPRPTSWPSRPARRRPRRDPRRDVRRGRARRPGLRPRAPRPARHRAAARRALMPLVAGVDSSTSACKVEVRDADTGELVALGSGAAPADDAAAQRAGPARPGGTRSRPRATQAGVPGAQPAGGDRRRRPAARPRRARRRRRACCARPSSGTTPSRRPTPPRWSTRSAAGGVGGGLRQRPGRQLHDHQAARGCAAASPTSSHGVATVLLPHDWLTWPAHRRAHHRPR